MWDGKQITKSLNNQKIIKSSISINHNGFRNKILHFGSINTIFNKFDIKSIDSSNRIVLTWFHTKENDPYFRFVPQLNNKVDLIHTSCFNLPS